MNNHFDEFVKKLSKELKSELPGFSAQKRMNPLGEAFSRDLQEENSPKQGSVLILIYPGNQPLSFKTVLILRTERERGNHAGQISFPGGRVDASDKDLSETALREAEEEIGIDRTEVSLLGPLTSLYIPVSNFMVYPFVGACNDAPEFKVHPMEVKELLEVEIADLLSEKNCKFAERFMKLKNASVQVPCFDINGKIIWGATAMIIAEFSAIIKRIKQ